MMASTSQQMMLDPTAYLKQASLQLSPDKQLQLKSFSEAWESQEKLQPELSRSFIYRIAIHLRSTPHLLYGLNSLISPHVRLECSIMIPQVNHYVLIDGTKSSIYSFLNVNERSPSSDADVKRLLPRPKGEWKIMLEENPDEEWLACLAQLLQEIIDDPSTDSALLPLARKRLIQLNVLPLSTFVHLGVADEVLDESQSCNRIAYMASGGNCDVHRLDNKGVSLCLRVLRRTQATDVKKLHQNFCSEVMVWRQLKHPNILEIIGVTLEVFPGLFCFVLPWLRHGCITSYLKEHPEHDKFISVGQIVDGVEYLHGLDPPVTHKDIKGANVLIRDDLVCVLTDFGLAGVLDSLPPVSAEGKGTMPWMAPELFGDGSHPPAKDARPRDIYSLGATIYEIYTGEAPSTIMLSVIRGIQPALPPHGNQWTEDEIELWGYVASCVQIKPEDRPTIKLLKDALQTIRRWQPCQRQRTGSFALDPDTPESVESVRQNLQYSQLTQQTPTINTSIPIHLTRRKSATLKAKGLHTPNTPHHSSLPDLEFPQPGSTPLTPPTPKPFPPFSFRFPTPPMTPLPAVLDRTNSLLPPSPLSRCGNVPVTPVDHVIRRHIPSHLLKKRRTMRRPSILSQISSTSHESQGRWGNNSGFLPTAT